MLVILGNDRRGVVQLNFTQHPIAVWLSRPVTKALPGDTVSRYPLRDRDASYGECFRNRVEAMEIAEIVTTPRSP